MQVLTADELAIEADVERVLIDDLVRIGALRPGSDGSFSGADIQRVQTVQAGLAAGISLENLERSLRERLQTLDYIDRFYVEPAPRSPRTYEEFAASFGEGAVDLPMVYAAFGLPEPKAESHLRIDEEEVVSEFLESWGSFKDREILVRAARLNGEGVRRIVESVVGLYFQEISAPLSRQGLDLDELVARTVEPAVRIAQLEPRLLVWLEQRHIEHTINALNFDELEQTLVDRGWAEPRTEEPPAIAFVDLSGFTDSTERGGDEVASRLAAGLQEVAHARARQHGGRVVKLLGDGVMFRFDRAVDAVAATLTILEDMDAAGLPPAHAGVDAGPLIERDGDWYGRTVNQAARIAGHASSGQVLVSVAALGLARDAGGDAFTFEPVEPAVLKGIPSPVTLYRAGRVKGVSTFTP